MKSSEKGFWFFFGVLVFVFGLIIYYGEQRADRKERECGERGGVLVRTHSGSACVQGLEDAP